MLRKAFVMSVNEGQVDEYERRHSPIWPELEAVLKEHGAHSACDNIPCIFHRRQCARIQRRIDPAALSDYSIFVHPVTRELFG